MSDYLDSLFSLSGKSALVTGGAKGIGRMISESLLQAGARVYISSRSAEDCEAAVSEMARYGECRAFPYDLSTVDNIAALAADIEQAGNGLDILVNNSGATWGAPLEAFPESGWDKVMDLNVKSPFYLVQKLVPLLQAGAAEAAPARIINIGSVAGLLTESQSAYSYMASKAAILHLTKGLARDLAGKHITVNAIAPGFFPSKMTKHLVSDEGVKDMVISHIPLGRLGEPADIGGLAIFLCSTAGAYMTGTVVPVAGGVELT
ncbi:SDR family oxidoreductase [Pseudohalioglobus sediminis]|uniref:SDR family oxidoreductase n=1 Tax=Pseudohalioglobus sediminis TaxID=2606449 RepID=A0A5B0WZT2_9GAMM|nr:SDR family oxidoreductase [Pseudohalioglobus sediminis]KAA1192590.1 SDR family oxidoreductase [Pseudohalioglobus sediminis]